METSTIKDTVQGAIQGVIEGLTPLAQKLQMPAEEMIKWAVKHNFAIAISEAFFAIVLFTIAVKSFIYMAKKKAADDPIEDYVFFIIPLLIGAIVGSFLGHEAIMRFVAPEWMTAKDIIELISGMNR